MLIASMLYCERGDNNIKGCVEGHIQHRQNQYVQDEQRAWELSDFVMLLAPVNYTDGHTKTGIH